jgi:hypothetical protein
VWLIIALMLTRLWLLAEPLHLIAGLYLILAGLGRFVEEARRGKLRQNKSRQQRMAIASVIAGALLTALGHSAPAPTPHFAWSALLPAAIVGVTVAIVKSSQPLSGVTTDSGVVRASIMFFKS